MTIASLVCISQIVLLIGSRTWGQEGTYPYACVCVGVGVTVYLGSKSKAGVIHSVSCISAGFRRRSATCSRINAGTLQMTCMGGSRWQGRAPAPFITAAWIGRRRKFAKGLRGFRCVKHFALLYASVNRTQMHPHNQPLASLPKWGGRSCRLLCVIAQIDQRNWTAWSIINRLGASLIDCEHVFFFLWEWRLI